MANSQQHTIEIIFAGVDNFSDTLFKINRDIGDFSKSASALTAPFKDFAEKLLAMEAVFAAFGGAILKARADIEDATIGISATLDLPIEKAKELEPVFKSIYSEGIADSIEEASESLKLAFQKFGDIGIGELDSITSKALALEKSFGVGLNDSIGAAKNLIDSFGISSSQAFDFIAAGFQKGLNGSDDFIQSITEYSTQFANGGANAEQFFSIMQSGYQEGYLGADKAADAFKEFRIRIQDGSKTTSEALALLGIDALELGKKMSSGTVTAAQAFETVIKKLNETKDSSDVMQAGVGLLGTQFEDLGTKAALNLDLTAVKMDDITGKAGDLQNKLQETAPFEKFWRTLVTEIGDIPIFDKFYEEAVESVNKIRELLPEAFDNVDFSKLESSLGNLKEIIKGIFGGADLTTAEGLQTVIQNVIDTFASFQNTVNGVIESFGPLFAVLGKLIESYNDLDEETQEGIGNIIGYGAQFSEIAGMVGGVTDAFDGAKEATESGTGKFFAWAAAAYAAFEAGYQLGEMLRDLFPQIDENAQAFLGWADELINFSGTQDIAGKSADEITKKLIAEAKALQDARKATDETKESLKGLSETPAIVDIEINKQSIPQQLADIQKELSTLEQTKIELEAKLTDATGEEKEKILGSIFDIEQAISEVSGREIELGATVDTKRTEEFLKDPDSFLSIEKKPITIDTSVKTDTAKEEVNELFYYVDGKEFSIKITPDKDAAKKTKEELEKIVPPEKQLKILADLDIAKFQEETKQFDAIQETIQKKLQFKAELNIAEVQANVEILSQSMDNINTMFTESSSLISDAFGLLSGLNFNSAGAIDIFRLVKSQISEQNDLQREALELQKEITLSQIKLNEARQKALLAGEPLVNISIDGSNMEYELRAMALAFIRFAQIEATNEGLESLLGV